MKFRRDYYDIHEKKIIFISNASWEILDRTFFSRLSRYNGGKQVTMVTEKRISRMKRTFFIDLGVEVADAVRALVLVV